MAQKIVLDTGQITDALLAPDGPVVRQMMVMGEAIKVATVAKLKPGFPRDFLGPYIVKRVVAGPKVQVGSMRTQTKPHVIRGNPTLVFPWAKGDRLIRFPTGQHGPGLYFFRKVNHPGSNMGPYLAKKLLEAMHEVRGG